MRSIFREYNYDWRFWALMDNASKLFVDSTEKELKYTANYIPSFKDTNMKLLKTGQAGVRLAQSTARYMDNILNARQNGKKIALITYNFSPAILFAFDIVPYCLEGLSAFYAAVWEKEIYESLDYCCEVGFTETSCSGQRTGLGAILAGVAEKPDFIVCSTPGVCDSNANAFAFASAYLDVPFCQLDYPPLLVEDRAVEYHRADFRKMLSFLEEQTGKKLDIDKLREICRELIKQDEIICEIQEYQRLIPSPVPGIFNLFIYDIKVMFSGIKDGTDILQAMLDIVKANAAKGVAGDGEEKLRGFFYYIDHYCIKMSYWRWLEQNGISHIGTMMTDFWQTNAYYAKGREKEGYTVDLSDMDTMIDSLAAQTSRMPMVKQIRGPYDAPHMWLDDTVGVAKLMKPDFLAFMGTMGCRNTWSMVKLIERDMEKLGYPTLTLYADSFDNRIEPVDTFLGKIDEFLRVRGIKGWKGATWK
jgi:benzoyl-CoA reductase/2-hydroxyglutaryl-CoA dehydratase subunit BcrC/BadD/HgdB